MDEVKSIVPLDRVERANEAEDHVLIFDLGPAECIKPKVKNLGKPFEPLSCEATIV